MFKLVLTNGGIQSNKISSNFEDFRNQYTDNTGNLMFQFAIDLISDTLPGYIGWDVHNSKANENRWNLLIPMANHIGKHADLSVSGPKTFDIQTKIVIVGIGAQFNVKNSNFKDVPKGTIEWLKHVSSSSNVPNISLRDSLTYEFFKEIGIQNKPVVLGCPSLLINSNKNLGQLIRSNILKLKKESIEGRIFVTAGNPHDGHFNLEQWLIKLIDKKKGSYIVQHPRNLICCSSGFDDEVSNEDISFIKDRFFPKLSTEEIRIWFKRNSKTYLSIPQWIHDLKNASFVVGTRIHGVQAAIQAGAPAVCLYIDSRTKGLCETMRIPCISADEFQKKPSIETIFNVLENWDFQEFDENRRTLAKKTLNFLQNNSVNPSNHLKKLAQDN